MFREKKVPFDEENDWTARGRARKRRLADESEEEGDPLRFLSEKGGGSFIPRKKEREKKGENTEQRRKRSRGCPEAMREKKKRNMFAVQIEKEEKHRATLSLDRKKIKHL